MKTPTRRVSDMRWSGWGVLEHQAAVDDRTRALVEQMLDVPHHDSPPVAEDSVALPESRLEPDARSALAEIVGPDHVHTDDPTRLRHVAGKSTSDLLRLRQGAVESAPDAVVLPGSHDEVADVLTACARLRIAVVSFGGGTSVVGGVAADADGFRGVVSLDVRRLAGLVSLDPVSGIATLQAGLRGPEAEELLAAEGWTLGHLPQSFQHATIGGFAATRSVGQASAGYGGFADMVLALKVATPAGTLDLGRAPASAAGPDLRQLFLGSEGTLGVITEVRVRIRPVPAVVHDEAWAFPDFATGVDALRRLSHEGVGVTTARLSDEAETGVNQMLAGAEAGGGCMALIAYEGTARQVDVRRHEAADILTAAGGQPLGTEAAAGWRDTRFQAPYLRDALLDIGVLVETLETATWWSNLQPTYQAVRAAVTQAIAADGAKPMVTCHVSHTYPTGASLYFTVIAAAGDDPVRRWAAAKQAATQAVVDTGATLTHHHAVGTDHAPWLATEVGALGVATLRAVKHQLDPEGILNPGKLLPPAQE